MRRLCVLALCAASAATPALRVSTVAGTGVAGYLGDGGPATAAQLNGPYGLVIGPDGTLYFCEIDNHCIRRLDLRTRELTTVAGNRRQGYSGDGGPALEASLNQPSDLRFDATGNLFFVEIQSHVVRRVDARTRLVSVVAGGGSPGFAGDGGPGVKCLLRSPHGLAFDPQGRLLICDLGNERIRRLDLKAGLIETFAGTGERGPTPDGARLRGTPLSGPRAMDFDAKGNLFVALRDGNAVYRIDPLDGRIYHVAGVGERGYAGDGGPARNAKLSGPKSLACGPDGSLYIADTENHVIRHVDTRTGIITTVLGTGDRGDGPDGDPLKCKLARPHGVAVSRRGTTFVADSENNRIRALRVVPPGPGHASRKRTRGPRARG